MKHTMYYLLGGAIIVGLAVFVFTQNPFKVNNNDGSMSTTTGQYTNQNQTGTSSVTIDGVSAQGSGNGSFSVTTSSGSGNKPSIPMPNINRTITISSSLDASVAPLYKQKIIEAQQVLLKDGANFSNWIAVGNLYKEVGDYKGAEEAWNYASALSPKNVVSFNNLGDLYHFYLHDFAAAERVFKQAIANDPQYVLSYINLADLYTSSYQTSTNKAEVTLKEGLTKNPGDIHLLTTLAGYYKDKGNTADAKMYYEQALTRAKILKDQNLIDQLTQIINGL